ncbi:14662_t:CDS:2, partial [Funneliformis geosporum]
KSFQETMSRATKTLDNSKKSANKRGKNLIIRRFLSELLRGQGKVAPGDDYDYDPVDDLTDIYGQCKQMGTYDLEKEIYRILEDSSKIRGYNARLRNEYINLNDENRRLKVENSKLVSQNACTEISLAKAKADNFAKSEEVKSLQIL